ncbi:MAG: dephospho-CoA kinase [Candidatus Microgenomates bacterium]
MLIGIVGQIACGKGVLKDYLINDFGFSSFSLSSVVHEEAKKRGLKEVTRKILQDIGNDLRKKYGRDVLAKRALEIIKTSKNSRWVIEGIRNTAEVELLKKQKNFTLIGIKSTRSLRFKRLLKRAKPWDPKTWEEFLKVDRRDLGKGEGSSGQQVGKCLAYCDYVLTNNKDIKSFEEKVKKILNKISEFKI